jgi:lactoylglutathione lyase
MRFAAALVAASLALPAGLVFAATPNNLPDSYGVIFTSLQTRDLEKAKSFYTAVLGMKVLNHYDQPNFKEYQLVFADSPMAGGLNLIRRGAETAPFAGDRPIHIVIRVKDLVATCGKVAAAGGKLERECKPPPAGGLSVGMALDPDGHRIELIQY